MGAIACRFADRVIVTSDNPRSEAPDAIIQDILSGCEGAAPIVEVDRRQLSRLQSLRPVPEIRC